MNVLIAIDSMKGSLSSIEAGEAAAIGIKRALASAQCVVRPLADGGEGTVEALVSGLGGEMFSVEVTGPRGAPVKANYGKIGDMAVMEMASAAGITLLSKEELNPLFTTTYGVGEMILDAVGRGCREFLIGIGGSATNDAGAGMLQALGAKLLDANGKSVSPGGAALREVVFVDFSPVEKVLAGCTFKVACDVTNPLCGPNGASYIFAPQKGATPEMVAQLDAALSHFADVAGGDRDAPGAGAAGGLGFAFMRFLGAQLRQGAQLVLEATGFEEFVRQADVVVTGEGRLDAQTAMGKAPQGVASLAKKHSKIVLAFSGVVAEDAGALNSCGIDAFFPIMRNVVTLEQALDKNNAKKNLAATTEQVFRCLQLSVR